MVKMVGLSNKQLQVKQTITNIAKLFGIDPEWAVAIAMTESSLGLNQLSKTGCKGVFQMSSIAMKDLLTEMVATDDELVDVVCGVAFLRLLLKRYKTIESATSHYCNPDDKSFYLNRVNEYIRLFKIQTNLLEKPL